MHVVWMGDVVNGGANMCKKAKEVSYQESYICVSEAFFGNLNEDNQKLLPTSGWGYRGGSVVNTAMDAWWRENCANQNSSTSKYGYGW